VFLFSAVGQGCRSALQRWRGTAGMVGLCRTRWRRGGIQEIVAPLSVRSDCGLDDGPKRIAAADVFCLPSYREGFGQVAVEAAACGLPVVASRIYGVVDAVLEGQTGLLHSPGDTEALHRHMQTLLQDSGLRRALGDAGRARVLRDFSEERVTRALLGYYGEITRKL
jgi:glycosyltransferase involved in cell wall biosynthesis